MNIIKTSIPGLLIIEPRVFKDSRGYFFESFSQREFDEKVTPILGHSINFVQDNESMSSYGVMRGLHYQRMPYTRGQRDRYIDSLISNRQTVLNMRNIQNINIRYVSGGPVLVTSNDYRIN